MRFYSTVFFLFFSAALHAYDLSGTVEVILKSDKKKSDLSAVVVYLSQPEGRKLPLPGRAKEFSLITKNKQFSPQAMVVPLGATVHFPNLDPIYHNIFSVSAPNQFDLGLYKGGDSKDKVFDSPGIVRVFCNVHPQMSATIVVSESPFYTLADKTGKFLLKDIPSGIYELQAYSAEGRSMQKIEIKDAPVDVKLMIDTRSYKKIQHKNKYGKDYSTDDDQY